MKTAQHLHNVKFNVGKPLAERSSSECGIHHAMMSNAPAQHFLCALWEPPNPCLFHTTHKCDLLHKPPPYTMLSPKYIPVWDRQIKKITTHKSIFPSSAMGPVQQTGSLTLFPHFLFLIVDHPFGVSCLRTLFLFAYFNLLVNSI